MKWHRSTETPRPDTEVLAEVKGFEHNKFIVLRWTKEGWWPKKDLALTPEDVQTIDNIIVDMAQHTDWPLKGKKVFYEEVLRRFIEKREKK